VANDWTPFEGAPFEDDGVTGREMVRRPGFIRLLTAAASKPRPFDVVVVRDLDRFARGDVFRVGHVLQQLADQGVRVFEYLKGEFVNIDGENALMTAFKMYGNRNEALKASRRAWRSSATRSSPGRARSSRRPSTFGRSTTPASWRPTGSPARSPRPRGGSRPSGSW
jgi:hypothetical protein